MQVHPTAVIAAAIRYCPNAPLCRTRGDSG